MVRTKSTTRPAKPESGDDQYLWVGASCEVSSALSQRDLQDRITDEDMIKLIKHHHLSSLIYIDFDQVGPLERYRVIHFNVPLSSEWFREDNDYLDGSTPLRRQCSIQC